MPIESTLGDFVKQLALRMEDENLVMLFKDESPWHMLFYRLKKAAAGAQPAVIRNLRFDWDGPYPRCQELSEFIQALHWTGSVVAANPSYDRIMLQHDVKEVWKTEGHNIPAELQALLDDGVHLAKEQFPQRP